MPNPKSAKRPSRAKHPKELLGVRPADAGAIQEGQAAALMIGAPGGFKGWSQLRFADGRAINPYRRGIEEEGSQMRDEELGRKIELRNAWDSGFASVPKKRWATIK